MLKKKNNIVAASALAFSSILATAPSAQAASTAAMLLHSSAAQILAIGVTPLRFTDLISAASARVDEGRKFALGALKSMGAKASIAAHSPVPPANDDILTGAISGKKTAPAQARRQTGGDVFNSVAIPFRKLGALKKAAETFHEIKSGSALECRSAHCRAFAKVSLIKSDTGSIRAKLDSVNAEINNRIRYRRDIDTHGRMDQWSSPSQTLARGTGDCEDYALLKMAVLAARGIPLDDMTVVILFDTKRKFYHAVLSVEVNGNHYILDNMRNQVLADSQLPNYQPLFSISNGRGFLHGTKTKGKALAMTSLDNVAPGEGGAL